jgi:hypothetical protein
MAVRIESGSDAGASVSVDPAGLINDATGALPALPTLPAVALPALPTLTQVNGTVGTVGGVALGAGALGAGIVDNALDHATLLGLGGLNVLSGNILSGNNVGVPVTVSGTDVNVLGGGIANNPLAIVNVANGFGGFLAPTSLVGMASGTAGPVVDQVLGLGTGLVPTVSVIASVMGTL